MNLLDEESDEETPLAPTKVLSEKMAEQLPQVMDEGSPKRNDDN